MLLLVLSQSYFYPTFAIFLFLSYFFYILIPTFVLLFRKGVLDSLLWDQV